MNGIFYLNNKYKSQIQEQIQTQEHKQAMRVKRELEQKQGANYQNMINTYSNIYNRYLLLCILLLCSKLHLSIEYYFLLP